MAPPDLSRKKAGKIQIREDGMNIRSLCDSGAGFFAFNPREKGINLKYLVDKQVPETINRR